MTNLPICSKCPSEVKPGEDECWSCLGETIPSNPTDDVMINGIIYHTISTQPTVYNGTITIPDTYTHTYHNNTGTVQAIVGIDFAGAVFNPTTFQFSTITMMPADSLTFTINIKVPTYTATIV